MANSYARVVLHTTFSTKYRKPIITPALAVVIKKLLVKHLWNLKSAVIEINCVSDHVHIIHTLPRTVTIAKLIQEAKKFSSLTINSQRLLDNYFQWQGGYATFSVNYRDMDGIRWYVRNQQTRHGCEGDDQKESFVAEYTRLLLSHGFEIHPEYTCPVSPLD